MLVAVHRRVDDAGLCRQLFQDRADGNVAILGDHRHMLAIADRLQRIGGTGLRHAGCLADHIHALDLGDDIALIRIDALASSIWACASAAVAQ